MKKQDREEKKINLGDMVLTKVTNGFRRYLGFARVIGIERYYFITRYIVKNEVEWIDRKYTETFLQKKFGFQLKKYL